MKRWMFVLPLGVGIAGLYGSTEPVIREPRALAYHCLFAGSVYAAIVGAGGLLRIIRPQRQIMELTAAADEKGFREVLSSKSVATRRSGNLLLLATALALAIGLPLNLLRSYPAVSGDFVCFLVATWIPVGILAISQTQMWRLSQAMTQPRLLVHPFPINRGTPLEIRLSFMVKRPLERMQVRAWLICTEVTVLFLRRQNLAVRKNVVEYLAAEQKHSGLAVGETPMLSTRLTISEGTPASGSAAVDGYPNYQWLLHCEFTGSREWFVDFPLEIG